jgi:oxaloacetate decarboxylase alpha subunit
MARVVDTTLRLLAQEPLAGRIGTGVQLEAAELLDQAGYHVLEVSGGGCFRSAVTRGVESPWERIRAIKQRVNRTPLGMALRGRFLVGTQPVEEDLVRRFVLCAAESGIGVFRIHDPLNDPEDLVGAANAVREAGGRLHLGLVYDDDPEGEARLVERAPALRELGADRILVLDPAGAIDPSRAAGLIAELRDAAGIPVGLYAQGPGGTALAVAIEAARGGADPIAAAAYPLAVGGHRPSAELLCRALDGLGLDSGVDPEIPWRVAQLIDGALGADENVPAPLAAHESLLAAVKGVPAGLVAGVEDRLRALGAEDRLAEVLDEVLRVRADLGAVPAASPLDKLIARQAIDHVLEGQRWASIDADMRALVRGDWGRTPAPIAEDVVALAEAAADGDQTVPPDLARAREEAGELATSEEELCLVALFNEETIPLLERLRGRHERLGKAQSAGEEERIRGLVRMLEESGLGELTVEENGTRITLRQQTAAPPPMIAAAPVAPAEPAAAPTPTGHIIESPMVGTFYRAPAPGEPAFVEEGARVENGQVLCILEAMKLFNELTSEVAGDVVRILVEDGAAVEFGQPLFEIDTRGA